MSGSKCQSLLFLIVTLDLYLPPLSLEQLLECHFDSVQLFTYCLLHSVFSKDRTLGQRHHLLVFLSPALPLAPPWVLSTAPGFKVQMPHPPSPKFFEFIQADSQPRTGNRTNSANVKGSEGAHREPQDLLHPGQSPPPLGSAVLGGMAVPARRGSKSSGGWSWGSV